MVIGPRFDPLTRLSLALIHATKVRQNRFFDLKVISNIAGLIAWREPPMCSIGIGDIVLYVMVKYRTANNSFQLT